MEFEIGNAIVHSLSGTRGTVSDVRDTRVPMVEVQWLATGEKEWLPPEMIRRDGTLPDEEAARVFHQQNGEVTKAYYAKMNAKGLPGQLAVALFRAQKRSNAAKKYRRGKFARDAYDVKNWSLSEICRILNVMQAFESAPQWGWKHDPKTPGYEHVLYVDLPTGQCSFHSPMRLGGPDYTGEWDGMGMSQERIIRYCDLVSR